VVVVGGSVAPVVTAPSDPWFPSEPKKEHLPMGLGVGILLVAVGAILAFAVNGNNVDTNGIVNVHSAGLVLLVIGVLGILLSVAFWSSWGGRGIGSRDRVLATRPVEAAPVADDR
jgi:hypothetical protein